MVPGSLSPENASWDLKLHIQHVAGVGTEVMFDNISLM